MYIVAKAFMDEIMEVCKKHNLAITPLQFGEISHHDGMEIVELEPDFEQYLRRRVAFSPVRLNIDAKEIK